MVAKIDHEEEALGGEKKKCALVVKGGCRGKVKANYTGLGH